ncbi:MAG TPA: xanthine dehydrogenase family protein molybdopterin-binding subunit [Conexibacter sp.]|nr:xanthine dehydrogenase family protein molybdopterin-binding subunit [Conexibacter sp.]
MSAVRPEAGAKSEQRRVVGVRFPRLEDERLLRGRARYIADIRLRDMVDVAVLRSQLPHARLRGVDATAAREAPGVVDVVTYADLDDDIEPVPDFPVFAKPVATRLLAKDRVRYVGAPIAAVVAEDRYLAEDAVELIVPDLEPLPAVATAEAALADDATPLFDEWEDNRLVDFHFPNPAVDEAFERLRVVSGSYYTHRYSPVPMECRGAVAEYRDGRLTLWSSTQFPHILRTMLAYVLPLPERDIRVIAADVGGGFGGKAQIHEEEYLVCWLAMRLDRPVRYLEDRYEHMISSTHSRDKRVDIEAAVNEDGTIEAVRGMIVQNVGSGECFPNGFNESFVTLGTMTMPYKIPLQNFGILAVATNVTPSGAYRGFGMPESTFARERIVDKIAREWGLDRYELRRKMMYRDGDFPYLTPTGARIEQGSHLAAFDRCLEMGRRALAEVRAQHAGDPSVRVGLGVATYVEGTTPTYHGTTGHFTSQDSCDVRFDPDGSVTAAVGIAAIGQGSLTMCATVVAEELGLPLEQVRITMGDTDTAPYGLGAWGSRGVTVAAGSLQKATGVLREKGLKIAAHLLEAAPEDLEIRDGSFRVRGSEQPSVSWGDVARAALVRTLDLPDDVEPGLEARATFEPPGLQHVPDEHGMINACASYANATHAAVVVVDVETGHVRVPRFLVVHDCGTVLNPQIVDGQIHGGIAQGIGGTLLEDNAYAASGQPQATTFMEYLMPTAVEVPPIEAEHFETPAPDMPFGAKGVGEAGVIGVPQAVADGVEDALSEWGIDEITETPITPASVRAAIRAARERSAEA